MIKKGSVWREKANHDKTIEVLGVSSAEWATHPVRVKTNPVKIEGTSFVGSESYNCSKGYILSLYEPIDFGESNDTGE